MLGPGQFARMKSYMEDHIDVTRQDMFRESVDEVRQRLDTMCEQVEEQMTARSDEVYTMMSRGKSYLLLMSKMRH